MNKLFKTLLILSIIFIGMKSYADTDFKIYNDVSNDMIGYNNQFILSIFGEPLPQNSITFINAQNATRFGETADFIHYNIKIDCVLTNYGRGQSNMQIIYNAETGDTFYSGKCVTSNYTWTLVYHPIIRQYSVQESKTYP